MMGIYISLIEYLYPFLALVYSWLVIMATITFYLTKKLSGLKIILIIEPVRGGFE
uniref:Probable G-protein coupled receptor 63 n=1 Tax=Magnetococcus massalia (strain MO-1) TaxID=451514 RepID=A0A1S7LIJ7_MAGMO